VVWADEEVCVRRVKMGDKEWDEDVAVTFTTVGSVGET
jgi:hypothetical protein